MPLAPSPKTNHSAPAGVSPPRALAGADGEAPGEPEAAQPLLHRAGEPLPGPQLEGGFPGTVPAATDRTAVAAQAQRHQPEEQQHLARPALLGLRLAATGTGEGLLLRLSHTLCGQLRGRLACYSVCERMKGRLELLQGAGKGDLLANNSGKQGGGLRQQGVLHTMPPFHQKHRSLSRSAPFSSFPTVVTCFGYAT